MWLYLYYIMKINVESINSFANSMFFCHSKFSVCFLLKRISMTIYIIVLKFVVPSLQLRFDSFKVHFINEKHNVITCSISIIVLTNIQIKYRFKAQLWNWEICDLNKQKYFHGFGRLDNTHSQSIIQCLIPRLMERFYFT